MGKQDDLHFENELIKLKLQAESGAQFMGTGNLPPEVESEWLKNIESFDEQFRNAKEVTVYDLIGKPVFRPIEQIADAEIKDELDRLQEILSSKGLMVESICELDDREMYRFITQELFLEMTNDIHVEGMMTHFTYEEFHPNHKYDIDSHSYWFVKALLNKDLNEDYRPSELSSEVFDVKGNPVPKETVWDKLRLFREAYKRFELLTFEVQDIQIEDEDAEVTFFLKYEAYIERDKVNVISGEGKFGLCLTCDYWCVNRIDMPGLTI